MHRRGRQRRHAGDYVRFNVPVAKKQTADNACAHDVVLIEETHEGFRVAADGIFTINAVQFLDNLRANGNGFTVIGNIYDNPEFAEAARHNIA